MGKKKNGFRRAGWTGIILGVLVMLAGVLQYNQIIFTHPFFSGLYQDTFVGGFILFLVGFVLLIARIRIS